MRDTACTDLPEPFEGETMLDEFEEPIAIDVKLPAIHMCTK